jgi:hypothetical protein
MDCWILLFGMLGWEAFGFTVGNLQFLQNNTKNQFSEKFWKFTNFIRISQNFNKQNFWKISEFMTDLVDFRFYQSLENSKCSVLNFEIFRIFFIFKFGKFWINNVKQKAVRFFRKLIFLFHFMKIVDLWNPEFANGFFCRFYEFPGKTRNWDWKSFKFLSIFIRFLVENLVFLIFLESARIAFVFVILIDSKKIGKF